VPSKKRRALLAAMAAAPFGASAQKPLPVVGILTTNANDEVGLGNLTAFRRGLKEAGMAEGRDVALEVRWAEGRYERLPAMALELARRRVAVIFAGSLPAALAAKQHAADVPMVFVMGADPVKQGIVASLQQPGGNATGVCQMFGALGGKRLELLRELVPAAKVVAILSNPGNPNAKEHVREIEAAAQGVGTRIELFNASAEKEIDSAFAAASSRAIPALIVADDPLFSVQRQRIIGLAARYQLPAIHFSRDFVVRGGLASYASDTRDNTRLAGGYVARILRGTKPADLPVLQPTRFELVVNLKTARALRLTIPPALRLRADELIE
jgi:putative ABC transport system substrate-binding protein